MPHQSAAAGGWKRNVQNLNRGQLLQHRSLMATANIAGFWANRSHPTLNGMNSNLPNPQQGKSLRQVYPHLGDSEAEEAEDNLRQYVALALRVFERLELDPDAQAEFAFDSFSPRA
jgi:hypothetical protein